VSDGHLDPWIVLDHASSLIALAQLEGCFGTTTGRIFSFILVVISCSAPPPSGVDGDLSLGGGFISLATSVRILIVDDFEPWRHFLCSFLQQYPAWQIICQASDGLEAIEKSRELQPDLILLDIGLPKLNGIEAARQIHRIASHSRILFFSENCCLDVVREALRVGGCGYVVKSDAAHDLLAAMEAVIANKQFVGSRFSACDFTQHPEA
jgi:CheY-like chemotaxis protein